MMSRSTAPEKKTDMNAMRQLANLHARIEISQNARVQNRDTQLKAMVNYFCAIGAALCGFACFVFISGIAMFIAVAMTAVVAVIYVREGRRLFTDADYKNTGAADDNEVDEEYEEYEEDEEHEEYEEDDEDFF